jgi:hypothetical protein
MGEPLGDCVTRKEGGRIIYGGGGGTPSNTTAQQTSISELPEWARGYAKDTLAKTSALTDINQNPYQQYGGQRIAGFTPMQQQAQQGASDMQTSGQLGIGSDLATAAGMGSLNTGQFGSQQAAQYMNPYMEAALEPQLRGAARSAQMARNQQSGEAVGRGAFGGSRDAIIKAEGERNLMTQLGDIRNQGYNTAFNNAQQQYNTDQSRRLQGLGQGIQAAGTLGQLGQTQYGQQMGINQLQNQYGGQQQAQQQQVLGQNYQDFLNQQNYPYKQLGFMSDMIRGLPLGQQSTSAIYQPPPNALQTASALGLGAYGAKQLGMFADGGEVQGYAPGGVVGRDSVTSEDSVRAYMSKLSVEQLQNIIRSSSNQMEVRLANQILNERISATPALPQNSISAMASDQMVDNIMPTEASMARGGIVSFQDAGAVIDPDAENARALPGYDYPGNEGQYNYFGNQARKKINEYGQLQAPEALTDRELEVLDAKSLARVTKLAGPSPYNDIRTQIASLGTQGDQDLQQGKGLAALAAIPAILQPGGSIRGIGAGAAAFSQNYAPVVKANSELKRSMAGMNMNLANAERSERLGLTKDAMSYTEAAQKYKADAFKAKKDLIKGEAELNLRGATAFRPIRAVGGAGGAGKLPQVDRAVFDMQQKLADIKAANPNWAEDPKTKATVDTIETKIAQGLSVIAANKTSDTGPTRADIEKNKLDETRQKNAYTAYDNMDRKERKAYREKYDLKPADALDHFVKHYRPITSVAPGGGEVPPAGGGSTLIFDAQGRRTN